VEREHVLHLRDLLGSKSANEHGQWVRLQCPLAPVNHASGTDSDPAWAIHVDPFGPSGSKCWACDATGSAEEILREAQDRIGGLEEALAYVREMDRPGLAGAMARLRHRRGASPSSRRDSRDGRFDLERYVARCSRMTSAYLVDRGLTRRDLTSWRIGYDAGPTRIGKFLIKHRVVFPLWDEAGELRGAGLRTVLPNGVDMPKYWDTPGLPKGDVFYGEDRVDTTIGEGTLVEGYLDVVVGSRYLPNTLGLLGANTGMGPVRVEKLRRWFDRVTLLLDPDAAGSKAVAGYWKEWKGRDGKTRRKWVRGIRDILRQYMPVRVGVIPHGEDPASLREKAVHYHKTARYL